VNKLWYFETLSWHGQWRPSTAPQRPEEGKAEGGKRALRGVCAVHPGHHVLHLDALKERYSPDGRLQATGK